MRHAAHGGRFFQLLGYKVRDILAGHFLDERLLEAVEEFVQMAIFPCAAATVLILLEATVDLQGALNGQKYIVNADLVRRARQSIAAVSPLDRAE